MKRYEVEEGPVAGEWTIYERTADGEREFVFTYSSQEFAERACADLNREDRPGMRS